MRVLIFGAGGVGLGFMGDLLSRADAQLVFADVNSALVESLAARGEYTISKADLQSISPLTVGRVEAIDTGGQAGLDALAGELIRCDFAITSLGARVLPLVGRTVAELLRDLPPRELAFNFLCCENHRDAAALLHDAMAEVLGAEQAAGRCGFVNTVVGRMCQNLTRAERDLPPLTPDLETVILVEDYDPFPVDAGALRGQVPDMPHLEPVPTGQFQAYEHRKLYGHNGTHALLAVLGKLRGYELFAQTGADPALDRAGRRALWEEMGAALVQAHPQYFTAETMDAFAANLYARLVNPVFGDQIERGARDTLRMIRPEDGRLSGAALFVAGQGREPRALCLGVAAALRDNDLGLEGLAEALAEAPPEAAAVVRDLVAAAEEALAAESAGDREALGEFLR
ncbi:MAG TPA: hypothetical protein VGM19_03885 [Armatimonadota bacterium]|jgi:mannitol-1-phosphate 5-dehydrogenase